MAARELVHPVERDFVEFIALKRQVKEETIEKELLVLKKRFRFESVGFRDLTENVQVLHTIFFGFSTADEIAKTYAFHAYLSILRHLSYSYQKGIINIIEEFLYFLTLITRGEGKRALCSLKRRISIALMKRKKDDIIAAIKERFPTPVIIDYGCGLAELSLRIAKEVPGSRFILVDIDSIMSEFTEYRFKKQNVPFETIKISSSNFYPPLPPHHVCIADEVMEHLPEPMNVLTNITNSLEKGGILYGDYSDHCEELFHTHTSLRFFREELSKDFDKIGNKTYLKR